MELAGLAIAYLTLQFSVVGGLWKLSRHVDERFQGLEDAIGEIQVVQAGDRARYEGQWELLKSAIEGNSERIDYRSQQLQERLRNLEKRVEKLEATT